MQPSPLSWLPWVLVVAGAALGASYVARTFGASLNPEAFATVVRKLLDARNADRAVKLTRAAPGVPLAAATRAAILACAAGVAQSDPSADYRSAGDLSPERVLAPVRAAYDGAFEALAAPVRTARYAALLGALLLVAGLSLAVLRAPPQVPSAVAAAFGLAMLAWAARGERVLVRSRDATFEGLRDAFEALIRDPSRAPGATPDATPDATPARVRVGFEVSEPGREARVVDSDADVIKIGSQPTAQVRLDAPGVARMHAVVEFTDGTFSVIDLGSDPQTRVNGEAVNRRALSDGDVLSIGDAELRVRLYR